jgi:branched-chain amino acid transport system substrate-binding protein
MRTTLRVCAYVVASVIGSAIASAADEPERPLKLGVLTDLSGVYSDNTGAGTVAAVKLAIEDFGARVADVPIEVLPADHQNKPDVGAQIARRWFDLDEVDAIFDVSNTAVSLPVNNLARERNKFFATGAASTLFSQEECSPNIVQWWGDNYTYATAIAKALVDQGGDSWFFLTADNNFGKDLQQLSEAAIVSKGGKLVGSVRHPLGTSDFSSFLLQAHTSGAKVIGLANTGDDTTNAIKQALEFGIPQGGQAMAALLGVINQVHAIGLKGAQGLYVSEAFYWDMNDQTRAWAKRFQAANRGKMPNFAQAGAYAVTLHYLKAIHWLADHGRKDVIRDGRAVVAKMKELPTDDPLFGHGTLREDGRHAHDVYIFRVKSPSESEVPWDYYRLVGKVAANDTLKPLDQSACPLIKAAR